MSDTTIEELTPALYDHSLRLYEAMLVKSHQESIETEDNQSDGEGMSPTPKTVSVYEGHLTKLFAELGLPNPYYTKILDVLKGQNCIEQLRRGGGVAQSRWLLLEQPTEEGFKILTERKRMPKGKVAIIEQRTKDLMRQISALQDNVESLNNAYQTMYDELQTVKRVLS